MYKRNITIPIENAQCPYNNINYKHQKRSKHIIYYINGPEKMIERNINIKTILHNNVHIITINIKRKEKNTIIYYINGPEKMIERNINVKTIL